MSRLLIRNIALIFMSCLLLAGSAVSQNILVLENNRTLRNIKYYQGNDITIIIKKDNLKLTDVIFDMYDSTIVLSNYGDVRLKDIKSVIRENFWVRLLSGFSMIAGAAYFGIDSFNRLINSEWPMVDEQTLAISAGIVAFGFILIPLHYHKIPVGKNWTLRVINPWDY